MKKRNERKKRETQQTRVRVARRRRPHVPPPESDVWPEEYRGENWKPAYAFFFEGKCQLCADSCPLPKSRQLLDKCTGITRLLHCTNHPRNPGGIEEVLPTDTCRNFKLKPWRRPKTKASASTSLPTRCKLRRGDKKIPLGNGLFVIVDAADYERLSKYRWYANRHGRQVYAVYHDRAKVVYMHRWLMRPRRGYVVDHIDHNGLNNRRRGFEKPAFRPRNRVSEPIPQVGSVQQEPLSAWECTWFVKATVKAQDASPDITTPPSWPPARLRPARPARGSQVAVRWLPDLEVAARVDRTASRRRRACAA